MVNPGEYTNQSASHGFFSFNENEKETLVSFTGMFFKFHQNQLSLLLEVPTLYISKQKTVNNLGRFIHLLFESI